MKQLLLLRHAKSDWSSHSSDLNRPLNQRGETDAKLLNKWFQNNPDCHPDYILCSPAKRAADTLQLATQSLLPPSLIHHDERLYLPSVSTIITVLASIEAQYQQVLLVGHNPGFEQLLIWLTETQPDNLKTDKTMTTCNLAKLSLPAIKDPFQPGQSELIFLKRPEDFKNDLALS